MNSIREELYFVAIKGKEKLERILIEHFHSRVQKRNSKKPPVRAVFHGEHIVGHLQRLGVHKR